MNVKRETFSYIKDVTTPEALKALPAEALEPLFDEIRRYLIECVDENGGHLASNLGVVELTVALLRHFDFPRDHLIFDVGHQSYVYKMFTKRNLENLRRMDGISGFSSRHESEYDCFGTGHSSTSLSAALGFARAEKLRGSDAYTIAVIGDGAYTGGMIHEALNNNDPALNLIIILNENEMSISKNIGNFANSLTKLRNKAGYFDAKRRLAKIMKAIPLVGEPLYESSTAIKKMFKSAMYGSNYFENLGLFYLGPVDGNDYEAVESLILEAKKRKCSTIIHLKTQKGKGYAPAEQDPLHFHMVSPLKSSGESFSARFGRTLSGMAEVHPDICAITAAMSAGTGLDSFRSAHSDRFFDVGIAEEHALTYAAGLAANGMTPYVAIYSTFLQRGYDNIIHDIALQSLPVVMCIDRAGLNREDGPTHHGIFDVAFLSHIPNMEIYTPATLEGLDLALRVAYDRKAPVAIRYPRGIADERVREVFYPEGAPTTIGLRRNFSCAETLDGVIITHGHMAGRALEAVDRLAEQGKRVGVLLAEFLKPYEALAALVAEALPEKALRVVTLEEEIRAGGMGMLLLDALSHHEVMKNKDCRILALDDRFALPSGARDLYDVVGLGVADIVAVFA